MPTSTVARPVRGLSDADVVMSWDERVGASPAAAETRESPWRDQASIRVVAERSTWLEPTVERLNRLLRLPDNWDLEGASRVIPRAAIAALELLGATARRDTPAPSIVPTEEGGVQLEWHLRGIDLEVEVAPSGRVRGSFADSADDSEWEADLTSVVTPLVMALSLLGRRG